MSSEDHQTPVVSEPQEHAVEEHSFDELAKGIAKGTLSRGQVLKLVGAAVLGSVLSSALPGVAVAKKKRKKKKKKKKPPTVGVLPTCDNTTCPNGCCVNNTCHTNDPQLCGTGGGSCVRCPDSVACVSGVCQPGPPPAPCSATTCPDGCCLDNTCHEGNPQACGTGGGSCTQCGITGVSCVDGVCQTATCSPTNTTGSCPAGQRCVSGTCVCDATSCPNGCCANGECHTDDPAACGTRGGSCVPCPTARACCNGVCCLTGEGCCGGACTKLYTSQNCGACGASCTSGSQGSCDCITTVEGGFACVYAMCEGGGPVIHCASSTECGTNGMCTSNGECWPLCSSSSNACS